MKRFKTVEDLLRHYKIYAEVLFTISNNSYKIDRTRDFMSLDTLANITGSKAIRLASQRYVGLLDSNCMDVVRKALTTEGSISIEPCPLNHKGTVSKCVSEEGARCQYLQEATSCSIKCSYLNRMGTANKGEKFSTVPTGKFCEECEKPLLECIGRGLKCVSCNEFRKNSLTEEEVFVATEPEKETIYKAEAPATHNTDGGKTTFYDIFEGCTDVDSVCEKNGFLWHHGVILKSLVGLALSQTKGVHRHSGTDALRDAKKIKASIEKVIKMLENETTKEK